MTDEWGPVPEGLADLDRGLRQLDFEPRASLGPEIDGRHRHGEHLRVPGRRPGWHRSLLLVPAAVVVLAIAWVAIGGPGQETTIDRCCLDLDGGGLADDGVRVVVQAHERVRQLLVYEDRDATRSFTATDTVRFARGPSLTLSGPPPAGALTSRHCCADYDGGGLRDDGLLILGLPPDRLLMVGLYEQRAGPAGGFELR